MIWKITSSKPTKAAKPEGFTLNGHAVEVIRSPRARRMRLAVDPRSGRVKLTLPKRTALRDGVQWAGEQSDWISRESAKLPQAQPIVPGMMICIGGDIVRLDWAEHYSRIPKRVGDTLCVGGALSELSPRTLRWLKREALRLLDAETREIGARAGVSIGKVGIGDPVSRWGSCTSTGDIRYSWRLILMPADVRRATVAHEVAHRIHMNHGAAFHALTAEIYGADPKPAQLWLKAHGAALHWFGRAVA